MNRWHCAVVAATVFGLQAPRAWAESEPCGPEPSVEKKDQARALHKQAFELHKTLRFDEAAETYVESLAHWPEPRIHLQAGVAFLSALRLLEAYEHIDTALRCGLGELSPDKLAEAERKMARLRARLGEVMVECSTPGAQVLFNDVLWFVCAGRQSRMVVAGQYVVTVRKDGHFPVLKPIVVAAGDRVLIEPRVLSVREGTQVMRRWPVWRAWALVGTGVVLGAVSAGLQWQALERMDGFERETAGCWPDCADADRLLSEQDRAIVDNRVALGGFAVAGVALMTGLMMAYLNRARSRTRPEAGSAKVRVQPMAARDRAGLSVGLAF